MIRSCSASLPFRLVIGLLAGSLLAAGSACEPTTDAREQAAQPDPARSAEIPLVCGPMTVNDPGTRILTFEHPNGGCVPPGRIVLYRCGPAADPLVELDARGDHSPRFLGGRFAVPVVELPFDAEPVAHAPGITVFLAGDRVPRLYVEQDDVLTRWLPLPDPRQVDDPPSVFLLGDSILDGSQTFVSAALEEWIATFDAVVGRASAGAVSVAGTQAALGPDVAVIELGTNDGDATEFRENADAILASFSGAPLVVWVTVHSPAVSTAEVNRQIRLAAAGAANVALADWKAAAPAEDLSADGIHLSPGHEGAFAEFLAPLLLAWHSAVEERGAARCGAEIGAALRG